MTGLIVCNKVFNTHTHIQTNGVIVSHAHPFDKASDDKPVKSHHHGSLEIIALETIDVFTAFYIGSLIIVVSVIILKTILPNFNLNILLNKLRLDQRGPPVLFS